MQAGLSEAFSAHADGAERRWPVIATLGFVGASCAVFWIVIGYGAARLLG